MVFKYIRNYEVSDDLRMSYADIDSKAANNAYQHCYSFGRKLLC